MVTKVKFLENKVLKTNFSKKPYFPQKLSNPNNLKILLPVPVKLGLLSKPYNIDLDPRNGYCHLMGYYVLQRVSFEIADILENLV